jgi:type VI secretion system protein ImpL
MSRRKLIISILLFLIYEAAVWFGAGALAAPANFPLIVFVLSALGLTVLVVYLLISRLTARPAPAAPPPQASQTPPAEHAAAAPRPGADPELDAVVALLNEANNRLAQSPTLASRRSRTSVYGLPLYLLGGPEGAGKTTTFLKAGLEPELLAGQVYRDANILPTRLVNLWYAGDALFAEASGSLFSQDAGRWKGLLDRLQGRSAGSFLKKLFPGKKQPRLRGFVLFVEIGPFLGVPDPSRIGNLSRRVQERLRLAGESFGTNFPVYVVFTKSDALPYFTEYFGRLTESEDQQILGCTLAAAAPGQRAPGEVFAEAETARLSEAFNTLYYSLAEKRMTMLSRETTPQKRPAVYEYPREMKRIRDTLVQFLVDVFRPNPLQPGPILRGFYFTGTRPVTVSALTAVAGGEQPRAAVGEATSLFNVADYQKRIGLAAETPSSPAETTVSRWCFVAELFHRVILPDPLGARVAFANRRHDRQRRVLFGALAAIGALFCILFIRSWWGNSQLLDDAESATRVQYSFTPNARATPSVETLRGMESLRSELATLLEYEREGAPWRLRWGLYSGSRVLPGLYDLYFQRFRQVFYEDIHGSIAATLSRLPAVPDPNSPYNAIYDRVKAYRMITECKCSPDAAFLTPVLAGIWTADRSIDSERQTLARKQIDFYASELKYKNPYRVEEKTELTDRGRQYLSAFGGVERLYRGMIEDANQKRAAARLADLSPDWKQALSSPGEVQAAFTLDGWTYVEKAIKDPNRAALGDTCVLGGKGAIAQFAQGATMSAQLENLYIQDYIRRWREFTAATTVEPFRSAADAAKKLELLSGNRSPLLAALFMISENTNFPSAPQGQTTSLASAAGAAQKSGLFNRLIPSSAKKAATIASQAMPQQPPAATPADISRVFQPVREVAPPGSRERLIGDQNRNYMNALAQLQLAMQRISEDHSSTPDIGLHQQARQAVDSGAEQVRQISQRFNIAGSEGLDTEVQRLLESPFREASRYIVTDVTKVARDKANGAARQLCSKLGPIERKFPFNPQSDTDASAAEVAAIFAPATGAFAQLQQQLASAMVKQGALWVPSPQSDAKLTPEFIRFVNQMQRIQDALFADGGQQMKLRYTLKPMPGANIQAISAEIDGSKFTSTGAQSEAKQLYWPGAPGAQQVMIRVRAGANIPFASYEGLWGVFRMMADADPRPPGAKIVELSKVRRGHGRPEAVLDQNDKPIVVRFELSDLPNGVDIFDRNFFNVRCAGRAAE